MSTLSHVALVGSSLALIFALMLLWRRSVAAYITAFASQSMTLAVVVAAVGYYAGDRSLFVVAVVLWLLKGIAIPMLLRNMDRRFGPARESQPYVNAATSLLAAGVLVLVAYSVTRPVVAAIDLPTRAAMPLAMALVFVSLFVLISRKKAITQIVAFLMLENGIALLAVLGAYGVPLIVELGVSLDALMGFLVMQVFVYHIHETFESIDVDQLSRLRH